MYTLPLNVDFYDVETLKILSEANNRIGELKGVINQLPNPEILLNAITLGEAKDSSEIENIITTYDELFSEMTSKSSISSSAKEVLRYHRAILNGYQALKENGFISINTIKAIQSTIEDGESGIRKLPGTVIKNTRTNEIIFIPPQSESEILTFLSNLEKYINYDETFDALINMAVIHYQFESIHPFYDGNGRTGRIINVLYLVMKNKITYPVLYLSRYIIRNKEAYYDHLRRANENEENLRYFVQFMLYGIVDTCDFTIRLIQEICSSIDQTALRMKSKLPKLYSKELVEYLYRCFYTKNEYFREEFKVTRQTASTSLKLLEEHGFLMSEKIGKEVIYKNVELFRLIELW